MQNIHALVEQVSKLPDEQLQQYAQQHKDNPLIVAASLAESNKRKKMREGAQPPAGPNQQPVVDEALSGIAALPAPNMETVGMAGGGIVGYAGGGDIPGELGTYDPRRLLYNSGPGGMGEFMRGVSSTNAVPANSPQVGNYLDYFKRPYADEAPNMEGFTPPAPEVPADGMTAARPSPAAAPTPVPEAPPKKTSGGSRSGLGALPPAVRTIAKESGNPTAVRDAYKVASIEDRMREINEAADKVGDTELSDANRKALEKNAAERDKLLGKEDTVMGMSLLQAGLAMMGSKSRSALGGISEGGLKGLQAYKEGQKELRTERKDLDKDDLGIRNNMAANRKADLVFGAQLSGQKRQDEQYGEQSQLARDTHALNERKLDEDGRQADERNATTLKAANISANAHAAAASKTPAEIQLIERVAADRKIPFAQALEEVYAQKRQTEAGDERALRAAYTKSTAPTMGVTYDQWKVQNGLGEMAIPQPITNSGAGARAR